MEAGDKDLCCDEQPSISALKTESPVLNISGRVWPDRDAPRKSGKNNAVQAPEPHKVSPTTFPVILSRILLKTDVPPDNALNLNPAAYTQSLCFLCLEKPASRKRVYHMFISNEKDLAKDYGRTRKLYENRKEYKEHVKNITVDCFCARAVYRRVQKGLTDVEWNKLGNVFETEMVGHRDIKSIRVRVDAMCNAEIEKLINYIKFMSLTKG